MAPNPSTRTLSREGAQRLRDAVKCEQCLMDSEIGDVCTVHKLLHSMEKQAKEHGKAVHVFWEGEVTADRVFVRYRVEVWRTAKGLGYYQTDGWGNLDFSTRDKVLARIRQAVAS